MHHSEITVYCISDYVYRKYTGVRDIDFTAHGYTFPCRSARAACGELSAASAAGPPSPAGVGAEIILSSDAGLYTLYGESLMNYMKYTVQRQNDFYSAHLGYI